MKSVEHALWNINWLAINMASTEAELVTAYIQFQ